MEFLIVYLAYRMIGKVDVTVDKELSQPIPQCVQVYEIPRVEPQTSEVWASDKPLPITPYCGWTVRGEKVCCPDTHGYAEEENDDIK